MDFMPCFITVIAGKLKEVMTILELATGRKSGDGKPGEERWVVEEQEPSWYDSLNKKPQIILWSFDIIGVDICKKLKESKLISNYYYLR